MTHVEGSGTAETENDVNDGKSLGCAPGPAVDGSIKRIQSVVPIVAARIALSRKRVKSKTADSGNSSVSVAIIFSRFKGSSKNVTGGALGARSRVLGRSHSTPYQNQSSYKNSTRPLRRQDRMNCLRQLSKTR